MKEPQSPPDVMPIGPENLKMMEEIVRTGKYRPTYPRMKVRSLSTKRFPLRPRGVRRNEARRNHDLLAWRLPNNHLQLLTGQIIVPYPFIKGGD
tara:strand:+ start:595 stop:876 length:282 start_codon:yes stop_codon:yes gene_type:complete